MSIVRTPYPQLPQIELFGFDFDRPDQTELPAIFRSYQTEAVAYFEEKQNYGKEVDIMILTVNFVHCEYVETALLVWKSQNDELRKLYLPRFQTQHKFTLILMKTLYYMYHKRSHEYLLSLRYSIYADGMNLIDYIIGRICSLSSLKRTTAMYEKYVIMNNNDIVSYSQFAKFYIKDHIASYAIICDDRSHQ